MIKNLIKNLISSELNCDDIIELRVRVGLPVFSSDGKNLQKVMKNGKVLIGTSELVDEIIKTVTDNSFYAFEYEFCRGFINYHGSKIAIAGVGVFDNGKLKSFKDITSVTIRIPRIVKGLSKEIMPYLENGEKSTLIIGKTATGKTTLLRDICSSIKNKNTLVIDERGELNLKIGVLGECVDILSHINKVTGIELGIRGLNPDVIVTDELFFVDELQSIEKAKRAGITVVSSFHGDSVQSYTSSELFKRGLFDRLVVLKSDKGKCLIQGVYDENGALL
ncbi:MAG: hypothetical protein RR107_00495 [Clostridia bacterium]